MQPSDISQPAMIGTVRRLMLVLKYRQLNNLCLPTAAVGARASILFAASLAIINLSNQSRCLWLFAKSCADGWLSDTCN